MTAHDMIKRLFGKLTPLQREVAELDQAEHALLEALSTVEFAEAMVTYNESRIKRLKEFIHAQS